MDRQDWPFHGPQQFTDEVDVGVGLEKPWIWAWVVTELVSVWLSLTHTTRVSSPARLQPGHPHTATISWRQGQLACLTPTNQLYVQPAFLCSPDLLA